MHAAADIGLEASKSQTCLGFGAVVTPSPPSSKPQTSLRFGERREGSYLLPNWKLVWGLGLPPNLKKTKKDKEKKNDK